jgi:periodic tryptophan protein 1
MSVAIPAVAWIRRGVAKAIPEKYQPDESELQEIEAETKAVDASEPRVPEDEADDEAQEDAGAQGRAALAAMQSDDVIKAYNLDNYDNEPDYVDESAKGLMYYKDSEQDPYLKGEDAELDELEDFTIKPTDLLVLAIANDDEYNHLDCYVYEEDEDNLFMHHDIILPDAPLSLAWTDFNTRTPETRGNLAAIGYFSPGIEIYNLDVVDNLEPVCTLGGQQQLTAEPSIKTKTKRKQPRVPLRAGSHQDAVIGLSWNALHRSVLASASADGTVKAWDLATGACMHTFNHHSEKVQTVRWHPSEGTVLLTGALDGTVSALDARTPTAVRSWQLPGAVESLEWNPANPQFFFASSENGEVTCLNALQQGPPLFRLAAHRKECVLAVSPARPTLLATVSADKAMKLWDITGGAPACIYSKDLGMGKLFSAAFAVDAPQLLVVSGEEKKPHVVNVAHVSEHARERFFPTLAPPAPKATSRRKKGAKGSDEDE